jgi:hypothetical protein
MLLVLYVSFPSITPSSKSFLKLLKKLKLNKASNSVINFNLLEIDCSIFIFSISLAYLPRLGRE